MAASRKDINGWLDRLYESDAYTHMIVVCDTYDWEDYPVYVKKNEDVKDREAYFKTASMQRVMEVYSKNHTREEQMAEHRAFHYD